MALLKWRYQTIVRANSADLSMISPHQALARSPHLQFILLADCITKARKGNAVDFPLPKSAKRAGVDRVRRCSFLDLQLHVAGAARVLAADLSRPASAGRRTKVFVRSGATKLRKHQPL
jgi:hypothetical protein